MSAEQAKPKILLVEDEADSTRLMSTLLKDEYELAVAESGEQSLDMVNTFQPDLVLLNVGLPEMDGYEVCQAIKDDPVTRDIPVVFLTSMDAVENEEKGLELGAIDYITKPFSDSIIKARIRNHIDLKKYRDEIARLAVLDGLTGISNRRRFDEFLEHEWLRARRGQSPISLILSDIDFFKNYNDNYGHLSGDDCLCAVAKALSMNMRRPADLVARYGGEEFACVLPETNEEGAVAIANELRESVAALGIEHAHSEAASHVTLSLGVSTLTPDGSVQVDDLILLADEYLYKAKRGGRNQVCKAKID